MEKNYRAELTGVFGDPVDGNPTGVMEEAGYEALGLNYRYITMKVTPEDFPDAMKAVKALHMRGVNLTMPHKIAVLQYLDEVSEAARIIGAVNTVVVRKDGSMFGENTDGKGFVEALERIAVECALAGAESITIINRTVSKAQELAELIGTRTKAESTALAWKEKMAVPTKTDILVNATCIGLMPECEALPDIDYDTITSRMTVTDVVFNPSFTRFLSEAQRRGAKTVSGLGMLAC